MISIRRNPSMKEVYAGLLKANPDAFVVIGFEAAYIGMTTSRLPPVAVYDYEECVSIFAEYESCTYAEANQFVREMADRNGGDSSPVFVRCS